MSQPIKMTETPGSKETEAEEEEASSLAMWDCGSPLYDSYELVSLDHLIQRHLMAIPSLGGSKRVTSKFYYHCSVEDTGSSAVTKANSSSVMSLFCEFVGRKFRKSSEGEQKRSKNLLSGFCYKIGFRKK